MATPFGGGIGRSEDLCGALSGAIMAIGACRGRTDPAEDKASSYEAARRLFEDFVKTYGSCRCRDLNKGDFVSQEHRARCDGFIEGATRLALLAMTDSHS